MRGAGPHTRVRLPEWARGEQHVLEIELPCRWPTIRRITNERGTKGGEHDSDLMKPAGVQLHHEVAALGRVHSLRRVNDRKKGRFSAGTNDHGPPAFHREIRFMRADERLRTRQRTRNFRDVNLLPSAGRNFSAIMSGRLRGTGNDHHAAARRVESVNETKAVKSAHAESGHDRISLRLTWIFRDETWRLAENDLVRRDIQQGERHVHDKVFAGAFDADGVELRSKKFSTNQIISSLDEVVATVAVR